MNKKGAGIGGFILFFIGVIVALTLIVSTAQSVGDMTNTITIANTSLGANAANGTAQYLTNYRAISSVVVYNETGNALVPATNYTATNNVVYNGNLAWRIVPNTTADLKYKWQISGVAQPLTYADDSATRTVGGLIVIMSAIGILGFAVWFFGRESGWM